ncbi:hypothetical protein ACFO1B_40230 [Dactylosporangium siamense]|uniref:Uncharacterized protein n=1 Tax=Dactylosporangium siamense TaxID=685454 RepID=A0A919UC68_9ACTN|nr:hypothetical protein [Dactylosporangium siamense]GIG50022.1 hypothetical protein Dsi01nite_080630 [Dactylosporangium siamense]
MKALVAAFGGSLPAGSTATMLDWLGDFSGEHWDFRERDHERDQVVAPTFDPETANLIHRAATALQLVTPQPPPHSKYRYLLVLGGLARACLQRTEYAARLVRQQATIIGELAALGSFRRLNDMERAVPGLADSPYEIDAMDVGMRTGFDIDTPPDRESSGDSDTHSAWETRTYAAADIAVHILAAPSNEPDTRRANTSDTYAFWAQRVRLTPADRILVVTSPIYVPFQHADAIRVLALRHGCGIDTIGFDPARATIAMAPGATDPDRYLQEIRSAILSMRQLHRSVNGSAAAW